MVLSTGKPNRPFAASGSCATAVWSDPAHIAHVTTRRGEGNAASAAGGGFLGFDRAPGSGMARAASSKRGRETQQRKKRSTWGRARCMRATCSPRAAWSLLRLKFKCLQPASHHQIQVGSHNRNRAQIQSRRAHLCEMLPDLHSHANDSEVLATSTRNLPFSKESWSISQGVSNALHDDECAVTAERAACLSNVTRSDSECVPTLWSRSAHKCRNNTSMRQDTGVGRRTHLPAQTTARHNGTPLELAPCAYLRLKNPRRFSAILSAGRCGWMSLTRRAVRLVEKHIV